jgi:copper chaperone CopZ
MHCDACEKKVRRTINKVEGDELGSDTEKCFSLIIIRLILVI